MDLRAIQKEIAKKKQFRACDFCRKCKKKCDGMSPCNRCKENNNICTYSPRALKTKKVESQIQIKSSAIADSALSRNYIELYFNRINPSPLFANLQVSSFDKPKSKSILLQYNAMLATSMRAYEMDKKIYKNFETRSKQLACDLIDDFSFDTALGYYLLAFHQWGENDELGCHYRDITLSICEKLLRAQKKNQIQDNYMISQIYKLQMAASVVNYVGESDFSILDKTVDKILQNPLIVNDPALDTLLLGKFQAKLWKYLFKNSNEVDYYINPFKKPSLDHCEELYSMVMQFENVLNKTFVLSEQSVLIIAVIHIFRAMLYYSNDQFAPAIFYCEQAAGILENHLHYVPFCSPFIATICHLIFLISYFEKNYSIANRISGFQRKLADIMPSTREILEKDMTLLRSVESQINMDSKKGKLIFSVSPPSPLDISFKFPSKNNQNDQCINSNEFDFFSCCSTPASIDNNCPSMPSSARPPSLPVPCKIDYNNILDTFPSNFLDTNTDFDLFCNDLPPETFVSDLFNM